jgi:uncharacterized protein
MLGGLVRWLRVLGVDVVHDPRLDDAALVRRAASDGRVILTRDRRLLERRLARRHLFIRSGVVAEQLRQVLAELELRPEPAAFLGRCLRCNTPLVELPPEAAAARVPPFVLRTQEVFRQCPDCGRAYWRATHARRMRERLAGMGIAGG